MGFYIIVETDSKASQQIQDSILALDPQASLKNFINLEELYAETTKEKITEPIGLLVAEFSTTKTVREWNEEIAKLRKHFAADNPEQNQDIQILMSAFDDGHVSHRALLQLDVNNLIFKPLDPLILKESLNAALNFKKRLSPVEIKSNKSSASIGILKDIEVISVSEMGFTTLSDAQLPVGSVSRYFSPIFAYNKKQSVWAQCIKSAPYPKKENTFVNQFQYFGVETAFLMTVRKYVAAQKIRKVHDYVIELKDAQATLQHRVALLTADTGAAAKLKEDLEHHFAGIGVAIVHFTNVDELKSRTNLQEFDIVLNMSFLLPDQFSKYFRAEALHFWLNVKLEDEELRKELAAFYKDLFYSPLDKSYFYKKLKLHISDLKEKEPSSFLTVSCHEKMKSANLIKISEISEVFVNFNYTRELVPKTHREFIFITEDETNLVELPGFSHFVEPAQGEKGKFLHQFVFFGMTDHYLKQIRLWIMQDYILQNKKES